MKKKIRARLKFSYLRIIELLDILLQKIRGFFWHAQDYRLIDEVAYLTEMIATMMTKIQKMASRVLLFRETLKIGFFSLVT